MDTKIDLPDLEKENERLRQQLAELDELPSPQKPAGDGVRKLKSVQDIATGIGKKIHAVPSRRGNQDYLTLYLLHMERERLVKETRWLKKRRLRVGQKIADLDQKRAEKEQKALSAMTLRLPAPAPSKVESAGKTGKTKAQRYEYPKKEWQKLTVEY